MEFLDRWLAETGSIPNDRPLVTLSYAQSLDGSISLRRGQASAISGPESQALTHQLRAAHDAILVGIGTVLADDPQLTVRLAEGGDPQVVVLDSHLRLPASAKLLDNQKKPWVFCTSTASEKNERELERVGVKIERQETASERIDLAMTLQRIRGMGVNTVMVEGGGEVIAGLLGSGLVDRLVLTIAPIFVDGYRVPFKMKNARKFTDIHVEAYGADSVILGRFSPGE